jgi:hypothetical protein
VSGVLGFEVELGFKFGVGIGPSLNETTSWLRDKIEQFAGFNERHAEADGTFEEFVRFSVNFNGYTLSATQSISGVFLLIPGSMKGNGNLMMSLSAPFSTPNREQKEVVMPLSA